MLQMAIQESLRHSNQGNDGETLQGGATAADITTEVRFVEK